MIRLRPLGPRRIVQLASAHAETVLLTAADGRQGPRRRLARGRREGADRRRFPSGRIERHRVRADRAAAREGRLSPSWRSTSARATAPSAAPTGPPPRPGWREQSYDSALPDLEAALAWAEGRGVTARAPLRRLGPRAIRLRSSSCSPLRIPATSPRSSPSSPGEYLARKDASPRRRPEGDRAGLHRPVVGQEEIASSAAILKRGEVERQAAARGACALGRTAPVERRATTRTAPAPRRTGRACSRSSRASRRA